MMSRRLLSFFALLALAGCARYVRVHHPLPPAAMGAEHVPKLARMAAVMRLDARSLARASTTPGKAALADIFSALATDPDKNSLETALSPARADEMLAHAAGRLGSPFSRVVAHQVEGPATNEFLGALSPSCVLMLTPSAVSVSQKQVVREFKDKKTGQVQRIPAWVSTAEIRVNWQLTGWPGGETFASGSESGQTSVQTGERQDPVAWARGEATALVGWADAIRAQILPRTAVRFRRMWKEKDLRKDGSGALATWNRAAQAEAGSNWEEARTGYRAAYASATRDKDRRLLSAYLAELDSVSPPPPPGAVGDAAWFDAPLAVAPFDNDTTNMDAPEAVRAIVYAELVRRGYRPLPLAEGDAKFRSVGVSQGAHLRAIPAARVAKALGAERWVVGRVDEFKTLNVGIYLRRQVRVSVGLADAAGRTVWETSGVSIQQSIAKAKDAGKQFLAGVLGTVVEKAVGTYLQEDSLVAVREAMPFLPSRETAAPPAPRRAPRHVPEGRVVPPPAATAAAPPAPAQSVPPRPPAQPAPPVTTVPPSGQPAQAAPPAPPVQPGPKAEPKPAPEPKPEPKAEPGPKAEPAPGPKDKGPEKPATPAEKSPVPETKVVPGKPPAEKPGAADELKDDQKGKGKKPKSKGKKGKGPEKPETPAEKSPVPETKEVPGKP